MISPLVVLPVVPVVNLRVMQIRICEYMLNVLFTLRHSHQTPTSGSGSLPLTATGGGYDASWNSFPDESHIPPHPSQSQTQ